ncbi:MAG: hypothetical protein IT378_25850 [Sandaracinaceae bacterium]|nr:hypothetical protein [Sandaracinaceae bacterium]
MRVLLLTPLASIALAFACNGPIDLGRSAPSDGGAPRAAEHDAASGGQDAAVPEEPPPPADTRAYLHADLWSTFWNDRTRCGAEVAFLAMCRARNEDCSLYERAVAACDPSRVVYGQVGPEKQGERLCRRGLHPDFGGCDARRYDLDRLRFEWYGAEWQGNWPFATLKIFEAGTHEPSAWLGAGLIAQSSLPGHAQAAMGGVENHGLSGACAMRGQTQGDAAYQSLFGGFAWIEVPADRPVTIVAAAGTNFANRAFAGCDRGNATQEPWVRDAPGAVLGCVYVLDHRFEPGRHYALRYGRIEALASAGPPPEIVAGFDRLGVDVRARSSCE